ncbi:MAG: hypothetical protein HHJ11_06495 [Phycicoccus sp.]|nr:hypothetical protein [Phycicoccus sp.]NMM34460.1 hypothetical protein [Phycicoccus sp.]
MDDNTSPALDPLTATRIRAGVAEAITVVPGLLARLDQDPAASLLLVAAAREGSTESERLLRQAVLGARKAGHTWEAVGSVLGVSRQAAQQRFAVGGDDMDAFVGNRDRQRVVNRATLFNEMQILEREGRAGWRLVGVGVLKLRLESSDQSWEHIRRVDQSPADRRATLQAGWQHVGNYLMWHYYTRPFAEATQK